MDIEGDEYPWILSLNNDQMNKFKPIAIELTYVNKNYFTSVPPLNTIPLPIPHLDFKNNHQNDEIDLNCYPFVHSNP